MLFEFIGVAGSGKTTLAAKLFAKLKEEEHVCELIMEQARFYIAKKKYENNIKSIDLKDSDQLEIFLKQLYMQEIMLKSCPLVIADSSIFNTILYKNKEYEDRYFRHLIDNYGNSKNLQFFCYPIKRNKENDPNRVHSEQFSSELHKKALDILKSYTNIDKFIHLEGDLNTRFNIVYNKVKEYLNK